MLTDAGRELLWRQARGAPRPGDPLDFDDPKGWSFLLDADVPRYEGVNLVGHDANLSPIHLPAAAVLRSDDGFLVVMESLYWAWGPVRFKGACLYRGDVLVSADAHRVAYCLMSGDVFNFRAELRAP